MIYIHWIIKKKTILKTNPPKKMILKVDFAIKLSSYTCLLYTKSDKKDFILFI